ncbi:TRAP transporter large permease [Dysosmobacter sp.]|uniref:TRAP transporter large permease n=1 Tax=Dysosmobacter sp. TaxID=2591382 RepID=UPI002D7E836B|nr:TRAP transporter large permease [Dysosmobacter sp.]MCI6053758.1 TRAP transporter large permease [Dysosmobacter sp.]
MAGLVFIVLLVLCFIGVPIATSIGAASTGYLAFLTDLPLIVAPQRMFTTIDSFPLMAVPFFVLSGGLMQAGGISKRLIRLADACVGHLTGGLAIVVIITSMFFAAVSGSSAATITALGVILIPAMVEKGYDKSYAASVQACSGQMGVIIPPSIPMVVYAVATETSIADLFKAGLFPGILMGASLIIFCYFTCKRRGYVGNSTRATGKEKLLALKDAIWAIFMPIIILGGIYSGWFTPTEAAAIAVGYAFIVGIFVYKELDIRKIKDIMLESAVTTATILFLISCAGLLAWIMGRLNVAQAVAGFFDLFVHNKVAFLLVVNLLLFFVGMFSDAGPAIIILAPLLAPIAESYNISLVHFGIIMVVNLAVGFCTPPVGVNLFLSSQIAGIKLEDMLRDVVKFLIILVADVLIISFVPALSTALL